MSGAAGTPARAKHRLETTRANQKVWLVKVPAFVAQRWRTACEQAPEAEAELGPEIARVQVLEYPDQSTATVLRLTNAEADGIPSTYEMRPQEDTGAVVHVFTERSSGAGVEGLVSQRFDLAMGSSEGEQLDPNYSRLARERKAKAETKTRTMQTIADPRTVLMRGHLLPGTVNMRRRELEKRRDDKERNKRTRLDKDELMRLLFTLFERQPHWNFMSLQKATDQPAGFLKEVLLEVAILNKRPPTRDMWELKPEYRTEPAPQAEAGA